MKLEGTHTVPAPRDVVWQRLMDPQALSRALPGCEKIEPNPEGGFAAEFKVGLGAIKGTYRGRVEILDPVPPERFRMKVEGKGTGGFVKGEATLTLAENAGGTLITYSGEAQVGGLIASVGQRLIQSAARQSLNQFFQTFAKQVQSS